VLAREAIISTVVAASLASILVWLGPPGVDLAAHVYQRTFLIQHGFQLWNNFWLFQSWNPCWIRNVR